jgi:hypothetical protein
MTCPEDNFSQHSAFLDLDLDLVSSSSKLPCSDGAEAGNVGGIGHAVISSLM